MIRVVDRTNRHRHAALLRAMHIDRRRIFVDWLRWDVPVVDGLEIDQFDDEHAVYLIAVGENGMHLGSIRLLPTERAHILGDIFPMLCEGDVPRGRHVFEMSRGVTSPLLHEKADQATIRRRLALALVEFAAARRVTNVTAVTHTAMLPQMLAIGWNAEPLGLPQEVGGASLGAFVINLAPGDAERMSADWELSPSQIDWTSAQAEAA